MDDEKKDELSRLDKLQNKLYSPNTQFQIRKRKKLQQKESQIGSDWEGDQVDSGSFMKQARKAKRPRISIFAKVAIIAFIFFLGSIGYAFFIFSGGQQTISGSDVDVTVVGPVSIGGGEELSIDVIVENRNSIPIYTVDVIIEYPDGTKASTDLRTDLPRIRDLLGDIEPNGIAKESYIAALFGEEGETKALDIRVEYKIPGSTAIFEKKKTFNIALQSSPIRLAVDTIKEITANQELAFEVSLSSNSNKTLKNILLKADYPFGFTFGSADQRPDFDDDTWLFDELEPQEEIAFQVRGVLQGQNTEERVFKWNAGIADDTDLEELGITFTTVPKAVTIIEPFLALDLALDGALENDLVRSGATPIDGRLTYTNNTGAAIRDVVITLKLDGEVLADPLVEVTDGFFNSTDNTIIWNKTTNSLLEEIPIGETETLIFRFETKQLATRAAVYKNPEIIIDAQVTGKRLSESGVPETVESGAVKRLKIASDVVLTANTSYDGEPFLNTGPIPPRVEQETTYTITFGLTNSSNALENGRVTAILPEYVRWNNVTHPSSERVVFNPVTREIEWNLGDIREHAGFIDPARALSMQLTLVPSASQIGNTPELIIRPTFKGLDTFTNTNITTTYPAPTIDLGSGRELTDSKVVE